MGALLKISSFVILHAKESDFEKSKPKPELQNVYDRLIKEKISFVTLIRDHSGKSINESVKDSFGVGYSSNKIQKEKIINGVSEFLKPKIRKMLIENEGKEKSFQQIQKILCDNSIDFEVIPLEKKFIEFMETIQELLKFKNQKVELSKIFEFTYSKNPQKFHPLVKKFYESIVNETKDLSLYVLIFSNMLSRWNDDFTKEPQMKLTRAKREYEDLESKKSNDQEFEKKIKDLTQELNNINITIDHFWREYSNFSQKSLNVGDQSQTIKMFQRLFMEGIPLEIVNGDNFSFSYPFLSKVLKILQNKKFSTISIIGPQSSGKSTLLNFLYGSSFPVSSGRCTRGLFASFVKSKDGKDVMILDSEGLFSVEKGSKEYDRKVVLLALAGSHKTMMNIKGELGTHVQEIMEICLYTLQSLRIGIRRPVLHFVLRDIINVNDPLNEQKSKILKSFEKVGTDFKFDWRKIVGFSTDNFQTMNSAYNNDQKIICGEEICVTNFNSLFYKNCQDLAKKLVVDEESEFNIDEWLLTFKSAWHCVQNYKDLDNLNAISDYMKQIDLNAEIDKKLHLYYDQLLSWGEGFQLFKTLSIKENEKKFIQEAKKKISDFGIELEIEFNEKGLDPASLSNISLKVERYLNRACDYMIKVWSQKMLKDHIDGITDPLEKDLRSWVDSTDFSNLNEKKINQIKKDLESKIKTAESDFKTKMTEIFTQNLCLDEMIPEIFKVYSEKYAKERGVVAFTLLRCMDFKSTLEIKFESIFENHSSIDYPKKFRYAQERKESHFPFKTSIIIEKLDQNVIKRFMNEINPLCNVQLIQFNDLEVIKKFFMDVLEKCHEYNNQTFNGAKVEIDGSVVILLFQFLRNKILTWLKKQNEIKYQKKKSDFLSTIETNRKFVLDILNQTNSDQALARRLSGDVNALLHKGIIKIIANGFRSELKSSTMLEVSRLEELSQSLSRLNDENCIKYYSENSNFKQELFNQMFDAQSTKLIEKNRQLYSNLCQSIQDNLIEKIEILQKEDMKKLTPNERYSFIVSFLLDCSIPFEELKLKCGSSITLSKMSINFKTDLIQAPLAISDVKTFCGIFKVSFDQNNFDQLLGINSIKDETYSVNFNESLGCTSYCPFCSRKCTGVVGCKNHSTNHMLAAWGGCHKINSREAWLMVCDSEENFKRSWHSTKQENISFPFIDLVKFDYPEWHNLMKPNLVSLSDEQKKDWIRVGKKICEKHELIFHENFGELKK
jgi:energy-coupling factor transporter ATP-binding protein EcfA2